MQTLESLRSKIESSQQLLSLVHTMKTLAAVNIRQYERAVSALTEYNLHIELGFQIALQDAPAAIEITQEPETAAVGVLVFGSDQGMVGQFNREIARYTQRTLSKEQIKFENCRVLAVGVRAASRLEQVGQQADDVLHVPGSLSGVQSVVSSLILQIESWRSQQDIDRILIFYNTPRGGSRYQPTHIPLIPIDPERLEILRNKEWRSKRIPTYFIDWGTLFSTLVREYFFVSLYRAAAESLASENASRLSSMQAAEKNVEDRLNELNARYHQMRQTAITEELLDVVAGFETLTRESGT